VHDEKKVTENNITKRVQSTQPQVIKVYQLLAHSRWFSSGTASSTTKTGRHDIAEILLKGALSTNNLNQIEHTVLVIGLYELLGNPTI
jgi:hypothetical protein